MTQTQRTIQFHKKAADPPGDARSDLFFWYDLGLRLKKLYAAGRPGAKNLDGIKNMTLDYAPDPAEVADWIHKDEPSALKIYKEINGYDVKTKNPLNSFANLASDGSTACGAWIYTGMLQLVNGQVVNRGEMNPGKNDGWVSPNWGWAWPANRHQLYNRASADPAGNPWSAKKKYTYWDAAAKTWKNDPGDGIDFTATKDPATPANPNGIGVAFHSGSDPFLLKKDGKGWLFAYEGLSDGPVPTHYEPWESPVKNLLYKQDRNPITKIYDVPNNKYNEFAGTGFPTVITTYRVTEHHLSGTMSRWLPWLAELMPELFVEISPELAREKGIANGDYLRVITERSTTEARALVTKRLRPLTLNGPVVHQVGGPVKFTGRIGPDRSTAARSDPRWLMMSDSCKHCVQAGCLEVCPTGALYRTSFGSVDIHQDVCIGCRYCVGACPFGVIAFNQRTGRVNKCILCQDRLEIGMGTACAKACPTSSLTFGVVSDLQAMANDRVKALHAPGQTDADIYGWDLGTSGTITAGPT